MYVKIKKLNYISVSIYEIWQNGPILQICLSCRKERSVLTETEDNRTIRQRIGDEGEELAAGQLERQGWRVISRNFRCRCGELDIVAVRDGVIAFVEVRTRRRTDYGLPCETVTIEKQHRLKRSAQIYLKLHPLCQHMQPRMDIFEVIRSDSGSFYRHIENAF